MQSTDVPLIHLRDIRFSYGELPVLDGFHFRLGSGETTWRAALLPAIAVILRRPQFPLRPGGDAVL